MRGEQTTVIEDAGYYPEHRYLGYTIFVEPDSIYEQHGIHDIESLKNGCRTTICIVTANLTTITEMKITL